MIYVVLGMHKSGTTLVSQILNSSGIDMGEFDPGIHYDRGNKYERAESLALDMDILDMESYDVLHLPHDPPDSLTDEQRERMRSIIETCGAKHTDWGMKDPRMCLTYHLWAEELPAHKLIVVYREPAHIWPRYRWRGLRGFYKNPGRAMTYQRLWIAHNQGILDALGKGDADSVVLGYHELMTSDDEFARLKAFVGKDLEDLRKPEMYRSRSGPGPMLKMTGKWLENQTGQSTVGTFAELTDYRRRQVEAETAR